MIVLRVPALRSPRAIRRWNHTEVLVAHPRQVGRIRINDDEDLGNGSTDGFGSRRGAGG